MRYLVSVEFSEIMTISECAEWLAFGRIPVPSPVKGQSGLDARRDIRAIQAANGYRVPVNYHFDRAALDQLLPGIDPDEYGRNLTLCGGEEPMGFFRRTWNEEPFDRELIAAETDEARHQVAQRKAAFDEWQEAARWFQRTREHLDHRLGKAQNAVFQALSDGRLKSTGFFPIYSDYDVPAEDWTLHEVAAGDWVPENVDWVGASLFRENGTCLCATVETEEAFAVFPHPNIAERTITGKQFGSVVMVGSISAPRQKAPLPKRSPGPKPRASKEQTDALVKEFSDRLATNRACDKISAELATAVEWMRKRYGLKISTATADRYLTDVLARHPKRKLHN
jgi:hypothetical protein